nr:hypothetical protein [Evansella caseinilytica]
MPFEQALKNPAEKLPGDEQKKGHRCCCIQSVAAASVFCCICMTQIKVITLSFFPRARKQRVGSRQRKFATNPQIKGSLKENELQ